MKFVLRGANIVTFGRAIHALAKVGEVLYISPQDKKVVLETVNSAHSAVLSFAFYDDFFEEYCAYDRTYLKENQDLPAPYLYDCCVIMKSILLAFRSLSHIEKIVDCCTIYISPMDCKLKIHFMCKYSVKKYITLRMIETEALSTYDNEIVEENSFSCTAKVLNDAANNFLRNQEEVTMTALPDRFVLKNYISCNSKSEAVHTEFTMFPEEFDSFNVNQNLSITYPLKELRAIINFADHLSLQITSKYGNPGQPICCTVSNEAIDGRLVMATVCSDEEIDNLNTTRVSTDQSFRDTEDLRCGRSSHGSITTGGSAAALNESMEYPSRFQVKRKTVSQVSTSQMSSSSRFFAPQQSTAVMDDAPNFSAALEDEDMLEITKLINEEIPPAAKKARYIFKRCFDSTFNPNSVPGSDKILAPDSDEEN